ncbi:MAG: four helix bundle protein [Phycisphaerales bacterium JB063]
MDDKAYRKLEVWQLGMDIVDVIYKLTRQLPDDERYGLVSQMRRAAISIPSNIAEGYGRHHRPEYIQHLYISRGSLMELETQLIACVRQAMVDRESAVPTWTLMQKTGAKLTKLIQSLG